VVPEGDDPNTLIFLRPVSAPVADSISTLAGVDGDDPGGQGEGVVEERESDSTQIEHREAESRGGGVGPMLVAYSDPLFFDLTDNRSEFGGLFEGKNVLLRVTSGGKVHQNPF
jgi:hypothetical protein